MTGGISPPDPQSYHLSSVSRPLSGLQVESCSLHLLAFTSAHHSGPRVLPSSLYSRNEHATIVTCAAGASNWSGQERGGGRGDVGRQVGSR